MKVQSSRYIPVNRFSKDDLIKEEIKLTKDIVSNNNKIISNMEKEIKCHEEIISNNNKLIDTLEKGLAELAPFKAYCIEQLRLNANTAYNSANTINSEITKIDNLHSKVIEANSNIPEIKSIKVDSLDNKAILREADLRLELGNTKEALNGYNKLIANRENKPVSNDYKPVEEKLRQASKLYMEFQPLIEKLSISNALKMKLYCTGISAHTNGSFSLSKAEVLHMINNQFFYPSN